MASELYLDLKRYLEFEGKQLPTGKPDESLLVNYIVAIAQNVLSFSVAPILVDMVEVKGAHFTDEQLTSIELALANSVFAYDDQTRYQHAEDIQFQALTLFQEVITPLLRHSHPDLQDIGKRVANLVLGKLRLHPLGKETINGQPLWQTWQRLYLDLCQQTAR